MAISCKRIQADGPRDKSTTIRNILIMGTPKETLRNQNKKVFFLSSPCDPTPRRTYGSLPKIGSPLLWALMIRIGMFWGSIFWSPCLGNYQMWGLLMVCQCGRPLQTRINIEGSLAIPSSKKTSCGALLFFHYYTVLCYDTF